MGLDNEGVGYAMDEFNAELVTDEMQARVEEAKQRSSSGEIEVHDYYRKRQLPGPLSF